MPHIPIKLLCNDNLRLLQFRPNPMIPSSCTTCLLIWYTKPRQRKPTKKSSRNGNQANHNTLHICAHNEVRPWTNGPLGWGKVCYMESTQIISSICGIKPKVSLLKQSCPPLTCQVHSHSCIWRLCGHPKKQDLLHNLVSGVRIKTSFKESPKARLTNTTINISMK